VAGCLGFGISYSALQYLFEESDVLPYGFEGLKLKYLQGFRYTVAVLQTAEALERVAYELAVDNIAEGLSLVRYPKKIILCIVLSFAVWYFIYRDKKRCDYNKSFLVDWHILISD